MIRVTEYIRKNDREYPEILRNIDNPPEKLYYKGNINLLNSNCLAVVGSRDLTEYGKYIEKKFIKSLVYSSVTIVSRISYWSRYSCSWWMFEF